MNKTVYFLGAGATIAVAPSAPLNENLVQKSLDDFPDSKEAKEIKDFIKGSNGRRDLKYWALSFWILFMIVFYTDPKSLHRYVLPMLPLYWVYALIWDKSSKIGKALLGVFVIILIIGTILFTKGDYYL